MTSIESLINRQILRWEQQQKRAEPKSDGIVRVGRESKGRKGKGVTLITGVPLDEVELADLAKRLKTSCGAGGNCTGRTS